MEINEYYSKFEWLKTPDNTDIRHGKWETGALNVKGRVVLLNGRSESMERYYETAAALLKKGYHLYSLDWRGQGLSTRVTSNRQKGFIENYSQYTNDLEYFFENVVDADDKKGPLIILAHSLGCHIAMRYLLERGREVAGVVLLSPMFDIDTSPFPKAVAVMISKIMKFLGRGEDYAIGAGDFYRDENTFRNNKLTSDISRYMAAKYIIDNNPDLAVGGVTYQWMCASFDSIKKLNRAISESVLSSPLLIISAELDKVVSNKAQRNFARKIKTAKFVTIKGALHEILMESDEIRMKFWNEFDRFTDSIR